MKQKNLHPKAVVFTGLARTDNAPENYLTKIIIPDGNGGYIKQAMGDMTTGYAYKTALMPKDFMQALAHIKPHHAFSYGIPNALENFPLGARAKLTTVPDKQRGSMTGVNEPIIARCREDMSFASLPGVMLLDIDAGNPNATGSKKARKSPVNVYAERNNADHLPSMP